MDGKGCEGMLNNMYISTMELITLYTNFKT